MRRAFSPGHVRSRALRKYQFLSSNILKNNPLYPPWWTFGAAMCRAKRCQTYPGEVKKHYKTV